MSQAELKPRPLKIIHIITGLGTGGAEVMLRELLRFAPPDVSSEVISLSDIGAVGREMQEMGVRVSALKMRAGIPDMTSIARLARRLRRARPDVVQTWLYHADVLGGLAARLAGVRAVAWGLHISHLDPHITKKSTLLMVALGAKLSRFVPAKIVCCARSTRELHVQRGYDASKMEVIFNGFDLDRFWPDANAREAVRDELKLPREARLVGLVARFHPQKDHANFIEAARLLGDENAAFVLCGEGCDESNEELKKQIEAAGLSTQFHLLGRRSDTSRVIGALDVLSLSSAWGEAFPMVVGEAMACGVPVAVTDVGDSAFLVDDCGRVTAPREPEALAKAWRELVGLSSEERAELGARARGRIEREFSIQAVSARYHDLYRQLAGRGGATG